MPGVPVKTWSETDLSRLTQEKLQLAELNEALKEGNAALKDANLALRELASNMKSERDALAKKNRKLRAQLAERENLTQDNLCASPKVNRGVQCEPSTPVTSLNFVKLPQEILLRIFLATLPPKHLCDASIAAGPRSQWMVSMNTRTSLVLVCRDWYGPASEALYSNIVFRRLGQISALARTFRSTAVVNAPDRSRYVASIRIDSCVVLPLCAGTVKKDLAFVLQRCTALKSFTFVPHPHAVFEYADTPNIAADPYKAFNPTWLWDGVESDPGKILAERCTAGLQHLAFPSQLTIPAFHGVGKLLGFAEHLTTLTLGAVCPTPTDTPMAPPDGTPATPPIVLPQLLDLQVHLSLHDNAFSAYLCEHWMLPALQQLTLVGCDFLPYALLRHCGTHLKYLHLNSNPWMDDGHAITSLSELCPALEHLVIPDIPIQNPQCLLDLPFLLYLDMWGPPQKRRIVELMGEMGRDSELPALQAIRILSGPATSMLPPRLPLICHPTDVGDYEVRLRTFPGIRILQTSWSLRTDYGAIFLADDEYDEDSDGSEYCESSPGEIEAHGEGDGEKEGGHKEADDDDGTSWISDSDAQELGTDQESVGGEETGWEAYDRDAVLERFDQSQREDFLFDDD